MCTDFFTSPYSQPYLTLACSGRLQEVLDVSGAGRLTKAHYFSLYSTLPVQNIDQAAAQVICSLLFCPRVSKGRERQTGRTAPVVDFWKSCTKSWSTEQTQLVTFLIALTGCRRGNLNSTWQVTPQVAQACP